ncbi:hypothetical protein [Agrobacterium cavarae]|uniref:hypothetical protein n=1 Tax=Agrobacterium cavarae TaxID=2528239 RepID=UPI0028A8E734|nr:hypothetical protein [Agrobacterium cavarae]
MAGPHRTYGFNETTSVIRPQPSESLTIDKLVPVAVAGAPHFGAMMLLTEKSKSSGDASIVTAEAQPDFPTANALPDEDVSTRATSIFRDENLYTIIAEEHDRTHRQRGVILSPP